MTRRSRPLWMLALAALSWGCLDAPQYPLCKTDRACNGVLGDRCVDSVCQNCTADDECRARYGEDTSMVCIEFRCTDATEARVEIDAASPCASVTDCPADAQCLQGVCQRTAMP